MVGGRCRVNISTSFSTQRNDTIRSDQVRTQVLGGKTKLVEKNCLNQSVTEMFQNNSVLHVSSAKEATTRLQLQLSTFLFCFSFNLPSPFPWSYFQSSHLPNNTISKTFEGLPCQPHSHSPFKGRSTANVLIKNTGFAVRQVWVQILAPPLIQIHNLASEPEDYNCIHFLGLLQELNEHLQKNAWCIWQVEACQVTNLKCHLPCEIQTTKHINTAFSKLPMRDSS